MVYGKEKVFDADRLIDLLNAFESFTVAASSARGTMDDAPQVAASSSGGSGAWQPGGGGWLGGSGGAFGGSAPGAWPAPLGGLLAAPFALLAPNTGAPAAGWPFVGAAVGSGGTQQEQAGGGSIGLFGLPPNRFDLRQGSGTLDSQGRLREALRFVFSQVRRGRAGLRSAASVGTPAFAGRPGHLLAAAGPRYGTTPDRCLCASR